MSSPLKIQRVSFEPIVFSIGVSVVLVLSNLNLGVTLLLAAIAWYLGLLNFKKVFIFEDEYVQVCNIFRSRRISIDSIAEIRIVANLKGDGPIVQVHTSGKNYNLTMKPGSRDLGISVFKWAIVNDVDHSAGNSGMTAEWLKKAREEKSGSNDLREKLKL